MGDIKNNKIVHDNNGGLDEHLTQNGLANLSMPVNIHFTVLLSIGGAVAVCAILFFLCYYFARRNARHRRLRHALQNADLLGQQGFADAADRLRASAHISARHSDSKRLSCLIGSRVPDAGSGSTDFIDKEAAARAYTLYRCMQDIQKENP